MGCNGASLGRSGRRRARRRGAVAVSSGRLDDKFFHLLDSLENYSISVVVYNSNLSRDWSRKLTIFVKTLNFGKR